jgi:hypothetical protein
MRHKLLRYSVFAIGLLLASMSFLLCLGNALTGEGRSQGVENAALIGMGLGNLLASSAILVSAVMARRRLPLAVSVIGAAIQSTPPCR